MSAITAIMLANGVAYSGFSEIAVSRGLLRCASHFSVAVTENLLGSADVVPLEPFTPIVIKIADQIMLSGFVDEYSAAFDSTTHDARITGRSKTGQLIDCMPDVPAGQFLGYSLPAIARALGNILSVPVVVQPGIAETPVADATMERSDTAFRFLDRLAGLSGVLLADDANGALNIVTAGSARASGRVVQGENLISGRLMANGERRFSTYIVKGQRGLVVGAGGAGFTPGSIGQNTPSTGAVLTQQRAVATDSDVPLYRPHVTIAESQLDQAQLQLRANWQAAYAYGHSLKASFTVPGWFQPDGSLWTINQIIEIDVPFFGLQQDLLVLQVDYQFSLGAGHVTTLTVGPVEGAIPTPNLLTIKYKKGKRRKGKAHSSINWNGVGHA